MTQSVKLQKVILGLFPAVFEPSEFKGKRRYDATFLIEKGSANDKAIRAAIEADAVQSYGEKAKANLAKWEGDSGKMSYLDGDSTVYDDYKGYMVLTTHRREVDGAPKLRDMDGRTELKPTDGKVYPGCKVNAFVDVFAQKGENPGMRTAATGIQFAGHGASFSGATQLPDDAFEPLDADADAGMV